MHYLVGLEQLGFDAYYVEAHARTPSMFVHAPHEDVSDTAAAFIATTMRRFGLENRWAFHALHDGDRCYGMTPRELKQLYRSAALIINLHGGTRPLEEHTAAGTLIYIETDPVTLQIELEEGCEDTIEHARAARGVLHLRREPRPPELRLPVTDRFDFRPTRQPVLLDRWAGSDALAQSNGDRFTTVGNWRQSQREVHFRGDTYTWSKDVEFAKVLELPGRTGQPFELALASYTEADQAAPRTARLAGAAGVGALRRHRPLPRVHRGLARRAHGREGPERRLRSGWFSDRSATYLAAAGRSSPRRPDSPTCFPRDAGCLPSRHSTRPRRRSRQSTPTTPDTGWRRVTSREEFFAHDRVLKPILEHVGLSPASRRYGLLPAEVALPDDLVLTPTSKRPLCLEADTVERRSLAAASDSPPPRPRRTGASLRGIGDRRDVR